MDKFTNLMYDFFSFSFPGVCILVVLSFTIPNAPEYIYSVFFPEPIQFVNQNIWHYCLLLALAGYIVGYISKPIGRFLILCCLSLTKRYLSLRCKFSGNEKLKRRKEYYNELLTKYKDDNFSMDFIQIRELTPKSAQYIEFWDMHLTMSFNLLIAFLIFIITQFFGIVQDRYKIVELWFLIIPIIASLLLLHLSLKYLNWWYNDVMAAKKFKRTRKINKRRIV